VEVEVEDGKKAKVRRKVKRGNGGRRRK